MIGTDKRWIIRLLKQLEDDKVIGIIYRGRRRYFTFNYKEEKEYDYEEFTNKKDLFDYDWLNDEE